MWKSQGMDRLRLALGGITALAPRWFSSVRSQSTSKALSPRSAAKSMPLMSGSTPRLS
jgi:hypothetical protein